MHTASLSSHEVPPQNNPFRGTQRTNPEKLHFQRPKSGPQNYGQSSGTFNSAKNRLLGGQEITLPGALIQKPQEDFS